MTKTLPSLLLAIKHFEATPTREQADTIQDIGLHLFASGVISHSEFVNLCTDLF